MLHLCGAHYNTKLKSQVALGQVKNNHCGVELQKLSKFPML